MKLILKAIIDFPDYFAGSDGYIYSKKKTLRRLKPGLQGNRKYYNIVLRKAGKSHTKVLHRLICTAFHGQPETSKMTVSHEDGDAFNNTPENLRWRSLSDNHRLKVEHGTDDCGHRNSRALFNRTQVTEIKLLLTKGVTANKISQYFKCDPRLIGKIKRGESYKR